MTKATEDMYQAQDDAQNDVVTYAESLQSSLFATRESTQDAYYELLQVIERLPIEHKAAVMSAGQILINTIAEEIKRLAQWR